MLQKYIRGLGCVIDVVYSELLRKEVIRVAAGRLSEGIYSSATWDHEGETALFDARTVEVIIPFVSDSTLMKNAVFQSFVANLREMLLEIGIDFGVQMEVIVDREQGVHLVQIRPSPEFVQGDLPVVPELNKRVAMRFVTAKVGKPGFCEGKMKYFSSHFRPETTNPKYPYASEVGQVLGRQVGNKDVEEVISELPMETKETFQGSVALWDPSVLLKWVSDTYVGIVSQLVKAQVAKRLFCNTDHGGPASYVVKKENVVLAKRSSLLFSLSWEECQWLSQACFNNQPLVRLYSDGVVGFVDIV